MVQLAVPVFRLTRAAHRTIAAVCCAILVGASLSCALKSPPTHGAIVRDALPKSTTIPPAWKANARTGDVTNDWLKSFNDPALDAIVAEAIANNTDLREAAARVAIARQSVTIVGSALLPQVSAEGGARRTDDEGKKGSNSSIAYAGVGWELDVWGRLRAQKAAARAEYEATALDYSYARQSLAALAAKGWYLATETRQLLALAEESVHVYTTLLDLVMIRRKAGKVSDLDVVNSRADLQQAESSVEAARQLYGESRRALEVLLGRYPAAEIATAATYPTLPAPAASGLPTTLLERRPDIVAAEREVVAAFREHEAAKLALLPDFSLSLLGGRLSDPILSLLRLNPWLVSAAIGAFVPIYEGGALRATIRIATAQQAEAVAHYGTITLAAFREVENTLANEDLLAARLAFEERAVVDRQAAVRIANEQYRAGRLDQLSVSQLQADEIAAEAVVIKLRSVQIDNRVRLHLALGGSFDATPATTLPMP
jgi:outer membrane protein, multidrug efflux system